MAIKQVGPTPIQPRHRLSCHCGAVVLELELPEGIVNPRRCDCSICRRKGAIVASVKLDGIRVLQGQEHLRLYQFNTCLARHYFCGVCGIYTHHQPAGTPRPADTLGRPGWLDWVIEEQRATREAVAVYDQSSFGKLLLQGRDARAVLQRLCAKDIGGAPAGAGGAPAPGLEAGGAAAAAGAMPSRLAASLGASTPMVYTAMLNERGGFESDLTVITLPPDAGGERFLLVTGSAQRRCATPTGSAATSARTSTRC